jgi:hypothetical protein
MRRLFVARRHVALDMADEYLLAWAAVRRAVEGAGGRAWAFRGATHEDQFLEFIEWDDAGPSPLDGEGIADGVAQLAAFGVAAGAGEWEEIA